MHAHAQAPIQAAQTAQTNSPEFVASGDMVWQPRMCGQSATAPPTRGPAMWPWELCTLVQCAPPRYTHRV